MTPGALGQVHLNPVYGSYFADPFVWGHQSVYYAIGTGAMEAAGNTLGKIFPVLQSSDFFQWQFASNALTRPDAALGKNFWAPAVAFAKDRFYLYYSVGFEDKNHQLRVAESDSPQGPYRDLKPLLDPGRYSFVIDPHPFLDEDGQWYMFFATDFLDHSPTARAGTALMAAPMKSMVELDPSPVAIVRANRDWQRFEANRPMYGKVWDWHTIEGPCVCKHDGRYYCFYSAGRWEDATYGVDYAVADHPLGPYSSEPNEAGPRVLRTIPGKLTGPGHNTIVRGPDGETDYIAYHAWDQPMKNRLMFIDKLAWTADGPRCEPTWTAALQPTSRAA